MKARYNNAFAKMMAKKHIDLDMSTSEMADKIGISYGTYRSALKSGPSTTTAWKIIRSGVLTDDERKITLNCVRTKATYSNADAVLFRYTKGSEKRREAESTLIHAIRAMSDDTLYDIIDRITFS